MQGGENKFRQTGKRQLRHERLRETKLDNASGKGAKATNGARNVGGSRMRSENDGASRYVIRRRRRRKRM